ncbi:MAG: DUF2510 domain-containing protein [Streptomycetaceae bacterium]|nr:DUF2510 domain-containing protein [Streptomycetaceae bacterium]
MTTGDRSAGWYPDPEGPANGVRWWDGSGWGERRAAAPSAGPPAAHGGDPAYRPPEFDSVWPSGVRSVGLDPVPPRRVVFEAIEPDRRRRRAALLVGGLVLALVAAAGGYFWGTSGGDDAAPAAQGSPSGAAAGSSPMEVGASTSAAPAATPLATSPAPPASSAPAAPPSGLLARWELNGNAAEKSGKFPGTASGTVTWSPEHGGSAVFAGGGSVQTHGPVLDTTGSFTVAAWAKLDDTTGHRTVVAQDGTQVSGFYLHYNKDARTWAFARTSDDSAKPKEWFTVAATQAPRLGVWTHLAGVYDAAAKTMTLYVDGTPQGTAVEPKPWKAAGPLTIGRATSNIDRFHGAIADVQAYARPLSAAEITALAGQPS